MKLTFDSKQLRVGEVLRAIAMTCACLLALVPRERARAELPAPDNLIYGSITVDGQLLTAARTNYVIQASRSPGGSPIASYRMGASTSMSNQYLLTLELEELAQVQSPTASLVGDMLYITIRSNATVLATGQALLHLIPERGHVRRLDITVGTNPDSDGDGLPDAWEILWLGGINKPPGGDNDGDGSSNLNEYLTGTNPNDANSFFHLTIIKTPSGADVSFLAEKAQGAGFEGKSRYYDLERTTNLVTAAWRTVPGYTNVLGDGQNVVYSITNGNPANFFFRCRVRLQTP
jgi:hypothetical protein